MKKSTEVKSGKSLVYPTNKPLSEQAVVTVGVILYFIVLVKIVPELKPLI